MLNTYVFLENTLQQKTIYIETRRQPSRSSFRFLNQQYIDRFRSFFPLLGFIVVIEDSP